MFRGGPMALSDDLLVAAEQALALEQANAEKDALISDQDARIAKLTADLAECQGGEPPDPEPGPVDIAGTYVLEQVASVGALGALDRAVGFDVKGASIRVPLSSLQNFDILTAAATKATSHGWDLALRWMFGRWMPANAEVGRTYVVSGGSGKAPVPFNTDGSPNQKAIDYYIEQTERIAAECRRQGVTTLHQPWFGRDWAEIAHGSDIRALTGYTYANWYHPHEMLFDATFHLAGPDLVMGWPMSGSGPLTGNAPFIRDMTTHMLAVAGPANPYLFVQANGVNDGKAGNASRGVFGAPDAATETAKRQDTNAGVLRGSQAIQPIDFDWTAYFAEVDSFKATQNEVYSTSFTLANKESLRTIIADRA
jgi:hypothetical protein